ncbi:MAG: hypothetical protein JKY52_06535, partial [Flavobacteriales bacterium]|nr:hypothetical protein [Flavobacteriales bacterium]
MKPSLSLTILKVVVFSVLIICSANIGSFAQTGATCNDAIPKTANSACVFTNHTMNTPEMWFAFTASSTDVQIRVVSEAFGTNTPHVHNISLFKGTCASPNLIAQDELPFIAIANDLNIDASGLVPGNTYYIRAKVPASATSCTAAACPGTSTVSFVICIQNIDVFQPLDFALVNFGVLETPTSSHTFYGNKGQLLDSDGNLRPDIKVYSTNSNPAYFITDNSINYVLGKVDDDTLTLDTMVRVEMSLLGANPSTRLFKTELAPGYLNFYLAHIPEGITNIGGYSRIVCPNVYPNIDMQYYSNSEGLKIYFIVHPGGDADDIVMNFNGGTSVDITGSGGLRVPTQLGDIGFEAGHAYQINPAGNVVPMPWQAKFEKSQLLYPNQVKLDIRQYSKKMPLIIQIDKGHKLQVQAQPGNLAWSTLVGGWDNDESTGVSIDNTLVNEPVMSGNTNSSDFPVPIGQFLDQYTNGYDGFISKFDDQGFRVWTTFIGGDGDDKITDYVSGVLCGITNSTNFPTNNPGGGGRYFQSNFGGGNTDAFIAQLDAGGVRVASTYFGGDGDDEALNLESTPDGLYMVGRTSTITAGDNFNSPCNAPSNNGFPTCNEQAGYFQDVHGGGTFDGFIAKFNASKALVWSTYFGGSGEDEILSATSTCGENKDVVFTGSTTSSIASTLGACLVPPTGEFPICENVFSSSEYFQDTYGGGGSDAFLAQFTKKVGLMDLQWSTYFGGDGDDVGYGLRDDGILVLTGYTTSSTSATVFCDVPLNGEFPLCDPFQSVHGGGSDAFVSIFSSCGGANEGKLIHSTYFGGSDNDYAYASTSNTFLAQDFFVVGQTFSEDLQTFGQPGTYFQPSKGNSGTVTSDAIVLGYKASSFFPSPGFDFDLVWATYFGGRGIDVSNNREERGLGITSFRDEYVYISGTSTS